MVNANTTSERLLEMDPEFYADHERTMSFTTNSSSNSLIEGEVKQNKKNKGFSRMFKHFISNK